MKTDGYQDCLTCWSARICKGPLRLRRRRRQELDLQGRPLAYPVRDGIPVMLEDEARRSTPKTACAKPGLTPPPATAA